MTLPLPSTEQRDICGAIVVRLPRRIDALSMTLRKAFGDQGALPVEMAHALAALDRIPYRR